MIFSWDHPDHVISPRDRVTISQSERGEQLWWPEMSSVLVIGETLRCVLAQFSCHILKLNTGECTGIKDLMLFKYGIYRCEDYRRSSAGGDLRG